MQYNAQMGGMQGEPVMMGQQAPMMGSYSFYGAQGQMGMMPNGQYSQTGPMGTQQPIGMGAGAAPPRTPMSVSRDFDQSSAAGPARSVASARSRVSRGSARSRTSTEMDARARRRAQHMANTGARRLNSAKMSDGAWKGVGYAMNDRPGTALTARSKHSRTGGSVASGKSRKSGRGKSLNVDANPKYGTRRKDDEKSIGQHGLQGELKQDAGRRRVRKVLARQQLSHEEDRIDFKSLDYTPITTRKPVDMRYPLRLRRQGLHIELAICVTIPGHAEGSGGELSKTLRAIAAELSLIQARSSVPWAEIAVCVIVDGRVRMSHDLAEYASRELRVFDASMLELRYAGSDTTMHVYERSVELPRHTAAREYFPPLQLIFGVKEHMGGQLHSLQWFYTGFCKQLQPTYCMVLEGGVVPRPGCLSRLVLAMDFDPQVGGVTPELTVRDFEPWSGWHWLQFFGYKYQAVFEQPFESVVGFVPRVPNSCAAWRWMAIRGEPLATILWAEERADRLGPGESQALLGYDRTLAHEVLTKKARRWKVQYESLAVADVPCPDSLPEVMELERKRINGQLYADVRYFTLCPEQLCCRSNHTICRRCCLSCQYIERAITSLMRFMFPGNLYLAFTILMTIALDNVPDIGETLGFAFSTGFLFLVVLQVFLGLGAYNAHSVEMVYYVSALLFTVLMTVFVALSAYLASEGGLSDIVYYAGLGGAGTYVLCSILMMQPVSMVFSSVVALLFTPIITVMVPMYAVAKLSLTAKDTVREERLAFQLARPEQQLAQRRESMKAAVVRHLATGEGGVDLHAAMAEVKQAHSDMAESTARSATGSADSSVGRGGDEAKGQGLEVQDDVDDSKSEAPAGRRASMESATAADAVAVGPPAPQSRGEDGTGQEKSVATGDGKVEEDGTAPAPSPAAINAQEFQVEDMVDEAATEVGLRAKADRGEEQAGAGRRRRGSFSSQASGASKHGSVAASIKEGGGMARIDTKTGQLRQRGLGRKATGKKLGDQTIKKLQKGKKQPKLVIQDESGKQANLPADVGYVIRECRAGVQRGHQAVLNALRREGGRVLTVNKKSMMLQESKREEYSAFRTRSIALYLAINYLWVSIVLYFGLTSIFAIAAATGVTFYIITRFIGVVLYSLQTLFLNACLDSCAAAFCCCLPCRVLGRACGRTMCACCYRCAGPEVDVIAGKDSGGKDDDKIKTGKSAHLGEIARDSKSPEGGESKNAPGRRKRRASVVDFGDDNGFVTHVQDVHEQEEGAAEFMDAHEGVDADGAEGEEVGKRRDKRSRSVVVPAAVAMAGARLKRKSAATSDRRRNMRRSMSGTAMEWLDHFKRGSAVGGGSARAPGDRGTDLVDAFGNPVDYGDKHGPDAGGSDTDGRGGKRGQGRARTRAKSSESGNGSEKDAKAGTSDSHSADTARGGAAVQATSHQPFSSSKESEARGASDTLESGGSAGGTSVAQVQPRTTVPLKGKTYKLSDPSAMPHTIGEEDEEDDEEDSMSRPTTGGETGGRIAAMDDEAVVAAVMASGYHGAKEDQPAASSWAQDVANAATNGDPGDVNSGTAQEAAGADLDAELARMQRASEVKISAAAVAVADSGSGGAAPTPSGLPVGGW